MGGGGALSLAGEGAPSVCRAGAEGRRAGIPVFMPCFAIGPIAMLCGDAKSGVQIGMPRVYTGRSPLRRYRETGKAIAFGAAQEREHNIGAHT